MFFVATGVASAVGGTVHAFFVANPSPLGTVLWRVTLMAIGVVAASVWMIAAALLWRDANVGPVLTIVAVAFAVYAVVIFAVTDAFWVAIVNYLPSTVFLILAYGTAYRSNQDGAIAIGLGGLALTLVAAVGQHRRVAIHPVYFNHNALYHAPQGIALFMIFWSGRYLIRA